MKTCAQMMLSVVMDGIKDAEMIMDYAEAAKDNEEYYRWFKTKAKMRAEQTKADYDYVKTQIKLEDKVKAGDDIAVALHSYLHEAVMGLMDRINRI